MREQKIEIFLRKNTWLLYLVTLCFASTLYYGIYMCHLAFLDDHYWVIFPAGLLVHSFFVITMHDGAHKSITRTKFDYFIMNFCSGLIVLPLYTELFKKYHLLHHAHTNTENDPLWSPFKRKFFTENKALYAFLQCLPFAMNLVSILMYQPKKRNIKAPKVNIYYVLLYISYNIHNIIHL